MTTHNTREEGVEEVVSEFDNKFYYDHEERGLTYLRNDVVGWLRTSLHQELQKAREEERERIEAIFKEHVPPHAMDLEDSVWLKRLLNKAFGHENLY